MVIDFHTHVFPEKIAARTVSALAASSGSRPHSDGTAEGLRSAMDEAGCNIAINLPVLTKATQFESICRFASELNAEENALEKGKNLNTGAHLISFAGIHPDDPDPEEHLHLVKELGFLGIKVHPDYQNTFFDDEKYIRIFSIAKELGLITVTHAGQDGAFVGEPIKCTPTRVLRVLDKLGGYSKLVLAHLGGNKLFEQVYSELAGEDLFFDTSYALPIAGKSAFMKILEKHGPEKILFATDSPWRNIKEQIDLIKSYSLGSEAEDLIFSNNAKALLGI